MKTNHNAFGTKELEAMRVSGFRDFPSDGENADGVSLQAAT